MIPRLGNLCLASQRTLHASQELVSRLRPSLGSDVPPIGEPHATPTSGRFQDMLYAVFRPTRALSVYVVSC